MGQSLDDFLGAGHLPSTPEVDETTRLSSAPAPVAPVEPQFVTSVTPSGIEVLYQWAPKRLYRLRQLLGPHPTKGWVIDEEDEKCRWREVPSVTTVLGVLDKSGALTWWGQGIGVEGVLELIRRGLLVWVEA